MPLGNGGRETHCFRFGLQTYGTRLVRMPLLSSGLEFLQNPRINPLEYPNNWILFSIEKLSEGFSRVSTTTISLL
ncbi:hypothetical protein AQUCO_00400683v1 [Aquilegia coerulea]|uniref:Uncharacterized protein n=1 Tax=Aquilegia coerulea TaxID=218851 RepID=A0A2G5EWD5_AQUCA|nr:hypothetical protein AQUCO_00400683v1 [Aquilegia coerulea]